MDVELSIQVVPTDEGTMLLAQANKDYSLMYNALMHEYEGEYSYIIPSSNKMNYLFTVGTYDPSILASRNLVLDGACFSLYRQPYSDVEIGKWCSKIEHHFECMQIQFKKILDRQNSDKHDAELEALIIQ
jgi:hypothetical protein